MAEKTYQELLDNIRSAQAQSARVAIDFMDGAQLEHLEEYLDKKGPGIKNWRTRGVLPLWENVTGLIIDRSAQTYQRQPIRTVVNSDGTENKNGTAAYGKLLEDSNFDEVAEDLDMQARLLNASICIAQYNDKNRNIFFSAVSQHNSDFTYDRPSQTITSVMFTGFDATVNGGMKYYYIDDQKVVDIEIATTDGQTGTATVIDSTDHGLGMTPAAILYDLAPPRTSKWGKATWEQLINFNLGVNMFHTEMKYNERFAAVGALFTNMKLKDGQTIGPDAVVEVEATPGDIAPFLEYRAPAVKVEPFMAWLDSFRENIGQEWGVNIKTAGEGSADSGFKLVVEELPGLQLRTKRQKPADTFEQQLYQVCLAISNKYNLGLVAGTKLKVKFPEPDLPVDLKGKAEVQSIELANKLTHREAIWLAADPSLTAEDIQARKDKIDEDGGTDALPTFDDVGN